MEDTEKRWSAEQVLALAPDAASRKAGAGLAAPGPWSGTGTAALSGEDGAAVVWGVCAGSGSRPYQTAVDLTGPAFHCTCPSRRFPCKHAVGLLLLWSHGRTGPGTGTGSADPPQWVAQWCAERAAAPRAKSAAGSGAGGGPAADPEAARRRAERRARRVAAGAADLEQRLADELRAGLATGGQGNRPAWDEVAARMVDAQAPGLAARARELGAIPRSGGNWPSRLLEEYGLLHLLARGCLALDAGPGALPGALADTVRSRVGFTTASAELLAGPTLRDSWLVLAQRDASEGGMTTRRIWLRGERSARAALLLSYGAAGRSPDLTLPVGRSLDAELAYHPGAAPLRAALGVRHGAPSPGQVPPGVAVGEALSGYGEALRFDPWLDDWPVVLSSVVPIPTPDGWQLADDEGGSALPVDPRGLERSGLWRLAAVSGGRPVTVFGTVGHRGFSPLTTWSAAEAVAL